MVKAIKHICCVAVILAGISISPAKLIQISNTLIQGTNFSKTILASINIQIKSVLVQIRETE